MKKSEILKAVQYAITAITPRDAINLTKDLLKKHTSNGRVSARGKDNNFMLEVIIEGETGDAISFAKDLQKLFKSKLKSAKTNKIKEEKGTAVPGTDFKLTYNKKREPILRVNISSE